MTPDEFEFWQRAYLAALTGCLGSKGHYPDSVRMAESNANRSLEIYRTAKATVAGND
jgi:hypothetical protein